MESYVEKYFEGERPLFNVHDVSLNNITFGKGESPLKESKNVNLDNAIFTWKYPLWYSNDVLVNHSIFETMARSGIWYTNNITIVDSTLQAPKLLRRCNGIKLKQVYFANAEETLWSCRDIKMENVQAKGDYFGMNSKNIYLNNVEIVGNYCFDGAENIEIHSSTFVSKDAFWNCNNVTIYDSIINGEYLAWNTHNLTLVNCTIESNQGLCYVKNLTMKNCRLLQTDLAFEYSENISADIVSDILSVKNPKSGAIQARAIKTLIMDDTKVDPKQTKIIARIEKRQGESD